MSFLIDTDVVVSALKGRKQDLDLLAKLSFDNLFISLITYGEIYEGIYFGRNPQAQEFTFRQFLRGVTILAPNKKVMREFAKIRGALRRSGNIIGDPDIIIAATAMYYNLTLVTHNQRDFSRISNLKLYTS